MAVLSSINAPGGAEGDTIGPLVIPVGGVLSDTNYTWVYATPQVNPAFNASYLTNQAVKASYVDSLIDAQTNKTTVQVVTGNLPDAQTGVGIFELRDATGNVPAGFYFMRDGSYLPVWEIIPAVPTPPDDPTIGTLSVSAQVGSIVTIDVPITMATTGGTASSLQVDIYDVADTGFTTSLGSQTVTTGIGLGAVLTVSIPGINGMTGTTAASFVATATVA